MLVRVGVALLLVVGPWTDEADELAGWDVARFQEIADHPGRAWRDHPVEYPPGSVAVIEALAGPDPVTTHRRIVVVMLLTDLSVAWGLRRTRGPRAAQAWLVIGLLLLPAPYLRLDLLAAALALAAVLSIEHRRPGIAGAVLAAAALVKVWPALLVVAWLGGRHWRAAATAAVAGGLAGLSWLAYAGPAALGQVLGYRGAEGWHVESVPGVAAGLLHPGPARLEQGAFRWGYAGPGPKLALLAVLGVVAALVLWRTTARPAAQHLAATTLVAALLVTSPLLSPQYLVWLLPFVALSWADGERVPAALTAGAGLLTTALLAAVGPSGVSAPLPQLVLVGRNLVLVGLVVVGLGRLGTLRAAASPAAAPRPAPGA